MKTNYLPGKYYVKSRGRGICVVELTKSQAKALFQIMGKGGLEIESITHISYAEEPTGVVKPPKQHQDGSPCYEGEGRICICNLPF